MQGNSKIWEEIYSSGHNLSYPDDAFIRLMYRLIKTHPNMKVMDHGFGSGVTTQHLAKMGLDVSGFEISQSAIDITNKRLAEQGNTADLRLGSTNSALPFESSYFDMVLSWNVLTYNTEKSLSEIINEFERITKPGGQILIAMSAPNDYIDRHSTRVNGLEKEINIGAQSGAQVIIPTEQSLKEQFFNGRKIQLGKITYDFDGFDMYQNNYWLIYYMK